MSQFNGWYFQTGEDMFAIVSKEFWDENGCLNDQHITSELSGILPGGFFEACESMFETHHSPDAARIKLLEAGFMEMNLFED